MSLQYLKKEVVFNTLGINVSYKVIRSLLIGMTKHYQSTQSNKFAISLQYLKKKLEMDSIFNVKINIRVSTSWYYHLSWKWPDMS